MKETERNILIEMYQLALELSNSEIPKLYELGHYLTDNLISKLCMVIASESDKDFNEKKYESKSFPDLYINTIKKYYKNTHDYNMIKDSHNQRNIYQHRFWSINHHFNRQFALDYIKKTKTLMEIVGIFKYDQKIEPSNYLEKIKPLETKNQLLKKNKDIQRDCINAIKEICDYGLFHDIRNLDESIVIASIELLNTHKELILPLGITYLQKNIKKLRGIVSTYPVTQIFIHVNCQKSLEINLDIYNFEIDEFNKLKINGDDVQDYKEISNILNCLMTKIKRE